MRELWLEYWGGMVRVKDVAYGQLPRRCRYLCTEWDGETEIDFYESNSDFVYAVRH